MQPNYPIRVKIEHFITPKICIGFHYKLQQKAFHLDQSLSINETLMMQEHSFLSNPFPK